MVGCSDLGLGTVDIVGLFILGEARGGRGGGGLWGRRGVNWEMTLASCKAPRQQPLYPGNLDGRNLLFFVGFGATRVY